jgi:hypothetical protein
VGRTGAHSVAAAGRSGEVVLDADDPGARIPDDEVEAARERADGAEPEALPAEQDAGGSTVAGELPRPGAGRKCR